MAYNVGEIERQERTMNALDELKATYQAWQSADEAKMASGYSDEARQAADAARKAHLAQVDKFLAEIKSLPADERKALAQQAQRYF
jgi:hypothetical protein